MAVLAEAREAVEQAVAMVVAEQVVAMAAATVVAMVEAPEAVMVVVRAGVVTVGAKAAVAMVVALEASAVAVHRAPSRLQIADCGPCTLPCSSAPQTCHPQSLAALERTAADPCSLGRQ